ncbi:mRNA export factor GLE1 isoform X2 [Cannabis sativa]|uniref:mRNA export factor GLE1 isoform X2 n=1 Tax=Cannabis sativa TaxID=3483 RepID=UPI0011E015B8|nr:mRNA export factor GLE1 isoform X2 [Cannabis sativa]
MGAVKLELRCPKNVEGIAADPEPDWSFDALLTELNALETKLSSSSKIPMPFTKVQSHQLSNGKSVERSSRPFVMRVLDDEVDDFDSAYEEAQDQSSLSANRFNFNDLYVSDDDDSENESALEIQPYLMEETGLVEGCLMDLTSEHQLGIKEEIRNKIFAIESDLMSENDKVASAFLRVDKYTEARLENERKLDTQYQRKIAEALDNHLTAIQRDHELRSQIEERKIRSDAAYEGAKRKEKALLEEKLRQEKAKAKAEAEAKLRAEEANRAAMEAQQRATKEAAEREANEASSQAAVQKDASGLQMKAKTKESELGKPITSASAEIFCYLMHKKGLLVADDTTKAAEAALKLERERLKKLEDLDKESKTLGLNTNKDYVCHERSISKLISQITGTNDVVKQKASELVKILKNPAYPQSIIAGAFARKVVSHYARPGSSAFACGYVLVLVTAEVPHLMDLILAELHKACIYTVPKHIVYTQSAFESKEAYLKTLGFREDEGKIENVKDYLIRVESYMKLYGALVQTEINGFQNTHGLKEGWAWIARFLNTLPANRDTAVALNAFLRMAGYALFKRYKSQFRKILSIISDNFLNALRSQENPALNLLITEIQSYIEDNKFLEEPEGRSLETSSLSSVSVPESDNRNSYQHTDPRNSYSYQRNDPRTSYSYQRNDPRNSYSYQRNDHY